MMVKRYLRKLLTGSCLLMLLLAAASCGTWDSPGSAGSVEEKQSGNRVLGENAESSAEAENVQDSSIAVAEFRYMDMESRLNSNIYESYAMDSQWLYLADMAEGDGDTEDIGITRKRISDGYEEKNYVITPVKKWEKKPLLLADGEGNCYVFWQVYSYEDDAPYTLEKYGKDGELLWRAEYAPEELDGVGKSLEKGTVTKDGRVFLYCDSAGGRVASFGAEGSLEAVYTPELDALEGIAVGKGGRVYGYCITGEEPLFLELGNEGETCICPMRPLAVYDGYEEGLCLRMGEGMFAYDPETGTTRRLWGWKDEYIQLDGSAVEKMYGGEGAFVLMLPGSGGNHERQRLTFASVTQKDSREYPKRQMITIYSKYPSSRLAEMVQLYNRQSRDYRVEIVVEEEESVLVQNFLRGEGGDLLDLRAIYPDNLARQGAFEELGAYYENSRVASGKDILESVREACRIEGKNVAVIPCFSLETLRARGEHTAAENWTVAAFLEEGLENRMLAYQSPVMALNYCMGLRYGERFIDYEKKECYFEGEEFRNILEACGRWESYSENAGENDLNSGSGEDWLYDRITIRNVWDIVPQESPFETDTWQYMGDDYASVLVGFPGWEGGEYQLRAGERIAMNSASEKKEGAWDFLEYLLSGELQSMIRDEFPSREDCLDSYLRDLYVDRASYMVNSSFVLGSFPEPVLPGEEDMVKIRGMAENAVLGTWGSTTNPVWEIVTQEAGMYFAGDAGLDTTVQKIQNRVQLYLQER